MRVQLACLMVAMGVGCSNSSQSGDHPGGAGARAGAAGSASSGASGQGTGGAAGISASGGRGPDAGGSAGREQGGSGANSAGSGGTTAGESTGGGAGSSSGGESGAPTELVPLPVGSRERAGVVNLVDADATAALEAFLDDMAVVDGSTQPAINLFLEHYLEDYDFVYLFIDHRTDSSIAGRYSEVNHRAVPGLGDSPATDAYPVGYRTTGRLRGAIGVQYFTGSPGGPLVHELFHNWGTFYGYPFGVGYGDENYGPHWGYTGLKGVHGGFDASTLRCTLPEGELPPNCTAEASGRYRYWVDLFFPNDNGVVTPFSPLELYMMGLVPLSEVPSSITLLDEATALYDTYVEATNEVVVEASGITSLGRDDFVESYGTALELPADERSFKAAFAVISSAPVPDSTLDEIGGWAEVVGNRRDDATVPSFEELTGGRAKLDTRLGVRRATDEPVPPPFAAEFCDVYDQDCGDGRACFFARQHTYCGITRGSMKDELCETPMDCAPGFDCMESATDGPRACEPYCSPDDGDANACATQCPWFNLANDDDIIVAGVCQAP